MLAATQKKFATVEYFSVTWKGSVKFCLDFLRIIC